jgi:hypothetical protein
MEANKLYKRKKKFLIFKNKKKSNFNRKVYNY